MIVLDNTDVLEGGASVASVVDYTFHGLVGSVLTQLAAGTLSDTLTAALYTAADIVVVTAITLVNTHSAAVNVTLRLDPADSGNPRYIIPKTVSLGVGYLLTTDGVNIIITDTNGVRVAGTNVSDTAYDEATWNGVTTIAPSKNAVRDKIETIIEATTVMLFGQSAAPTGWTKKTDWTNQSMIVYTTGNIAQGGSVDAKATHTHTGGSHTLETSEIPSHSHEGNENMSSQVLTDNTGSYTLAVVGTDQDGSTGGGGSHSHGATNANTQPYYLSVIAATKD